MLRNGVVDVVSAVDGFELTGAAGTVAEGRTLLAGAPDVLLVDLDLPDGSGLELIAAVRSAALASKVLVLSVFGDVRSVVRAIEEGADGYLLKDAEVGQVEAAIHSVCSGGAPISPAVASHLLARVREERPLPAPPSASAGDARLTTRELAVLEALGAGWSFKETAQRHGVSVHTVGDHVKSIYRKLVVNSRSEAVYKAVQTGLIRLDR